MKTTARTRLHSALVLLFMVLLIASWAYNPALVLAGLVGYGYVMMFIGILKLVKFIWNKL